MKVIRTIDTYAWHRKTYYGIDVPSTPLVAQQQQQQKHARKIKKFDPINWKNNDLYALLGLQDRRHDASFEEIRNAYRSSVLQHHPDKQAQRAAGDDDSLFKVLQKAFSVLSDPERRQQYESVDFDETIPKACEYSESEFWETFPQVFARNSLFSLKQPVPELRLGTTREETESFYTFWFNFESWRRFEFLDEEEVEGGERAEKRYIEKKNKAARQKRKTEDNARISKLVELSYKNDPRVKGWKEEEKRLKELKKQQSTKKPIASPIKPTISPSKDAEKKAKEEQVRQALAIAGEVKAQKKAFRAIFKDNDFFTSDIKEMERVALMMEQVIFKLSSLELKELGDRISNEPANAIKLLESGLGVNTIPVSNLPQTSPTKEHQPEHNWTVDQIDLLIKAVKLFPPGVPDRWSRITEHLNKTFHVDYQSVLKKSEDIKAGKLEPDELSQPAIPVPKKRDPRVDQAEPTILIREHIPNAAIDQPWSTEEQLQLETAMKTFGPDTPDRWTKISETLQGRTKQEVVRRVKEIAEKLKQAKKH